MRPDLRKCKHVGRAEERGLVAGPGIGVGRFGQAGQVEHGQFGRAVGVADQKLHQEAIELGLGQGIGSLVLDRVLGGQDPEGLGENERLVADGDLPFLHGFEESALNLGRRPIDLVGQQHAGDDRAGSDVERAGGGPIDLRSGQVGGKQVGGELDAAEGQGQGLGKCPDGPGFGQAGNTFDQDMPPGEERDDQPLKQRCAGRRPDVPAAGSGSQAPAAPRGPGSWRARDRRWT